MFVKIASFRAIPRLICLFADIVGLETSIKTYLKGECVDYNWFFPFTCAPTVKQLKLYAQERQRSKMLYKVKTDVIVSSPRLEPLAPYKFCLMLLPFKAASCSYTDANTTFHF
jgi:hypothetical protein